MVLKSAASSNTRVQFLRTRILRLLLIPILLVLSSFTYQGYYSDYNHYNDTSDAALTRFSQITLLTTVLFAVSFILLDIFVIIARRTFVNALTELKTQFPGRFESSSNNGISIWSRRRSSAAAGGSSGNGARVGISGSGGANDGYGSSAPKWNTSDELMGSGNGLYPINNNIQFPPPVNAMNTSTMGPSASTTITSNVATLSPTSNNKSSSSGYNPQQGLYNALKTGIATLGSLAGGVTVFLLFELLFGASLLIIGYPWPMYYITLLFNYSTSYLTGLIIFWVNIVNLARQVRDVGGEVRNVREREEMEMSVRRNSGYVGKPVGLNSTGYQSD
ncbi:hypothetical protein HDU76_003984 [Blyttiomyces sp. JEL0837]|nr:hypothetical protein HDU76_003984 [Blyttiomyces sp. JEL0837]